MSKASTGALECMNVVLVESFEEFVGVSLILANKREREKEERDRERKQERERGGEVVVKLSRS